MQDHYRYRYTVFTHEEAQNCIKSAACGARVRFFPIGLTESDGGKNMGYEICLEAIGMAPVYTASAYSLPFDVETMQKNITKQLREVSSQHKPYEINSNE